MALFMESHYKLNGNSQLSFQIAQTNILIIHNDSNSEQNDT